VARRARYFERRHDSAGRVLWYQLQLSADGRAWEPVRVRAPRAFREGDKLLDLTAAAPTKQARRGGEWRDVPLSRKALRYWVENRIPVGLRRLPAVERARAAEQRALRSGRVTEPERIRVFQRREDGSSRRFTIGSWARFMTRDKYAAARERVEEAGEDFVLGIMDDEGDLGEVLEELD
jgi:hypothetical protein